MSLVDVNLDASTLPMSGGHVSAPHSFANQPGLDIVELPLAGHGLVQDRVDEFQRQLEAFAPLFQSADLVVVSAHSQGCVVASRLHHFRPRHC